MKKRMDGMLLEEECIGLDIKESDCVVQFWPDPVLALVACNTGECPKWSAKRSSFYVCGTVESKGALERYLRRWEKNKAAQETGDPYPNYSLFKNRLPSNVWDALGAAPSVEPKPYKTSFLVAVINSIGEL